MKFAKFDEQLCIRHALKMLLLPPYISSARGQCAVLLLMALHDLYLLDGKSVVRKGEAIGYIAAHHWFALEEGDERPYPSKTFASPEPRWHTLIAWARKDSVIDELVSNEARDAWGLTRSGRTAIEQTAVLCNAGKIPMRDCFLWSSSFKKVLKPDYEFSATDAKRPQFFYQDVKMEKILELLTA